MWNLQIISRNYLSFLRVTFRLILKFLRRRLLDVLLFNKKGYHKEFSKFSKTKAKPLNATERIVLNKFQVYSLQMSLKLTTSQVVFKNFVYL